MEDKAWENLEFVDATLAVVHEVLVGILAVPVQSPYSPLQASTVVHYFSIGTVDFPSVTPSVGVFILLLFDNIREKHSLP